MTHKEKRIGISGGTFDPIHNGHLITAEFVMEKLDLEKVIFIPSGNPPHKKPGEVLASEHRYNMVDIAITGMQNFEASKIELDRAGMTYTIDTLKELKDIYGNEARLFFITGADVIRDLTTWKDFESVIGLCEFVAAFRPNYDKANFLTQVRHLQEEHGAVIHLTDVPLIDISSSGIRERVKTGKPIKYLVPDSVADYIAKNGLYK